MGLNIPQTLHEHPRNFNGIKIPSSGSHGGTTVEQGPPRRGWRSGIPHHRQGIGGNAAMEAPGRKGLVPLGFPKVPGFQWFPQKWGWTSQLWDCPSPRTSVTKDQAHSSSSQRPGKDSASPRKPDGVPRDSKDPLPQPRQMRDDLMSHSTAPWDVTGMGFPCRAWNSSWETSISSCWPKAGRGS